MSLWNKSDRRLLTYRVASTGTTAGKAQFSTTRRIGHQAFRRDYSVAPGIFATANRIVMVLSALANDRDARLPLDLEYLAAPERLTGQTSLQQYSSCNVTDRELVGKAYHQHRCIRRQIYLPAPRPLCLCLVSLSLSFCINPGVQLASKPDVLPIFGLLFVPLPAVINRRPNKDSVEEEEESPWRTAQCGGLHSTEEDSFSFL